MLNVRPCWMVVMLSLLWALQGVCTGEKPLEATPIIAVVWKELGASGASEVVIDPYEAKLKAHGLTIDDLRRAVRGRRFVVGEWGIEIGKEKINLADLAKLTLRELQAPPFTVTLPDGREVVITPDAERIGRYVVTGEYFEQTVRDRLADFRGGDPGKVHVLDMIPVPGTVIPHLTEQETMRHLSVGEPIEKFAKLQVRRKPQSPRSDTPKVPDH